VLAALKAAGALLVFGLAMLVLSRAFRRWRPAGAEAEAAEEERDSVFAARSWRDLLRALLRVVLRRRDGATAPALAAAPNAAPEPTRLVGGSVRELYRELLRAGASAGVVRAASTTPLEHQIPLNAALRPPEAVEELTRAYVEVRYAERDQPPSRIEALRAEVERLQPRSEDQ
jgi:hypothetical protein